MHPQCDNIELKKTQTTIPLVCFRVYDIWLVKNQLGRHLRWNYMPLHPLNEFRGSKLSVNDKNVITIHAFEELFHCQTFWWSLSLSRCCGILSWKAALRHFSGLLRDNLQTVHKSKKRVSGIRDSDSSTVQICCSLPSLQQPSLLPCL